MEYSYFSRIIEVQYRHVYTLARPTKKEPNEPVQPTVEVCRGLPRTQQEPNEPWRSLPRITEYSDEMTILCKPEAHTGNMLILTVINLYFIKTCKNLSIINFAIVYCACILYLKL